jgi:hypothetical protein
VAAVRKIGVQDVKARQIGSERGIGKLTLAVFGTILFAIGFAAYNIIPFYYYYFELVNQMEAVIRVADTENDQAIRKKLLYHIKKMQIPAVPEDLKIEREGHHMKISLSYEEVFFLTFKGKDYDIYRFPFTAYAEGNY